MVPENTAWSTLGFTAGAMATTASDLSAFTHQLFVGDFLNALSLQEMTQFPTRFGLGLFKIQLNDKIYWGHEGEITGFEAMTVYDPEQKIVISICSNTTPFQIQKLLDEIDLIL
jgi:zinc transporter ZupT